MLMRNEALSNGVNFNVQTDPPILSGNWLIYNKIPAYFDPSFTINKITQRNISIKTRLGH